MSRYTAKRPTRDAAIMLPFGTTAAELRLIRRMLKRCVIVADIGEEMFELKGRYIFVVVDVAPRTSGEVNTHG